MAQSKKTEQKGEPIKIHEKITVYATGTHPYGNEGDEMIVHPLMAEKLEKAGWITRDLKPAKTKEAK